MTRPMPGQALPQRISHAHFIGVAGSGMSGIARVMHEQGITVSGSDRFDSEVVASLRVAGIDVHLGHEARNIGNADCVVASGAVRVDNAELVEARSRGLTVLHRSDALRFVMGDKRVLAVAGSHGKTTSTAMLATALVRSGRDISCVNGGVVSEWGVSSRVGSDDVFVIEADESDRSFVNYRPAVVLITNVAPDHLDFYGTLDAIYEAFREFAHSAQEALVLCADDEGARELGRRLDTSARVVTYGWSDDADLRLLESDVAPTASAVVSYRGQQARFELAVPGRLNVLNATGVVGVLVSNGMTLEEATTAVSGFRGADRRFQFHGELGGVRFFDDHAHHPTEVAAALETARAVVGPGRVITLFQPHLFSRTHYMAQELADAFAQGSDHTIFLDIFGSREDPIEGVTTDLILSRLPAGYSHNFEPDWARACELAVNSARPGDIVLTMSTGDLYQIVPQLLEAKKLHDEGARGSS